jgi:hypothetical protein
MTGALVEPLAKGKAALKKPPLRLAETAAKPHSGQKCPALCQGQAVPPRALWHYVKRLSQTERHSCDYN